ncbi:hypothetical protein AKJ37_00680 [candidate division MSBL1 archaeon SCGC-AAA259I09]|uniref:ParB/Spo0J HTH domain-containing protein n=1 Tax=candidate division MSBL1 archaeon SCGC-AAA259I09 TaxID=1698267 RepID=A0A133UVR3_9EURY|nr:hypothetical protein AKJ37_00680 [candidate division MSBL1 archaeon SCGC-AAA259I09]
MVENWFREDLAKGDSEKAVYEAFKVGIEEGIYESQSDMAEKTGISQPTVNRIVRRFEEEKELDLSPIPRNKLTHKDFDETRPLKDDPALRKKVLSLTENVARDNLTKIEEARAYAKYITDNGYETNLLDELEENPNNVRIPSNDHPQVKELADQIGKYTSSQTINSRLQLLTLPEEVQNAVESGEVTLRVAEYIARLRQLDDSEFAERKMKELALSRDLPLFSRVVEIFPEGSSNF